MIITRRGAIGGLLGSTIAAGSRFQPAQAAVPVSGVQAPAFYRSKVGDIEITAISDGYATYPKIAGFVNNATDAEVSAALADQFMPTDRIQIPFTSLVINTAGKLIVLDTGYGDLGAPTTGSWMKNFRAAGFSPDAVDMVIISHFHGDHINGLRLKDGTAVFPKAEIKVPEVELAYWMNDSAMGASSGMLKGNFDNARRVFTPMGHDVTTYKWDAEVAPGMVAVGAPGHTPGHTMFAITSGNARFMAVSDITNVPMLFVRNPDWACMFDQDAEMARKTRHRVLDMVASERMEVSFYHAPFPSQGFITRDGANRYNLVPSAWKLPI